LTPCPATVISNCDDTDFPPGRLTAVVGYAHRMKDRWGSFARVATRDIGGVPGWALVSAAVVAFALFTVIAVGAASPRAQATYERPDPAPTLALPAPRPLVPFIGDSYTQGAGGEGVRWTDLVGEVLGWDSANVGLGGTGYVATSGLTGCGREYCGTYLEASREIVGSPRVIVVSGGRNDLGQDPAVVEAAASQLFADLQTRFPEAQIIVFAPLFDDDTAPQSLARITGAIRSAATANGVTFLDTGQIFAERPDLISDDGIHPNAAGYEALAAAAAPLLAAAVRG
jgi:lysophospholipase L1-like esterase